MEQFFGYPKPSLEKKELEPKLLFKLVLMRHQKATYIEEGTGLTEEGEKGAIEDGKKVKEEEFITNESPIITLYSPKARTKGTLEIVANEAGISIENSKALNVLTAAKVIDEEAFDYHTDVELEEDPQRIAEAYYTHDIHKNHPEIIEPHLKRKERLYRAMEYLIRHVVKNNGEDASVPQIWAVSHFEMITHLINDVFGIENTGYRSPLQGEQVKISGFSIDDKNKILLEVEFRDLKKKVIFNRETRLIEEIAN